LDKISKLKGVFVECFVFASQSDSESLPLNRFYRYKFDVEPRFENGHLAGSFIRFDGIPKNSLLTLGMDVPGPWLIRPQKSIYDLDNIKLEDVKDSLDADFKLQSILVQGK
jgi:UDP-glucose:glycoprotein glucosyltransferase